MDLHSRKWASSDYRTVFTDHIEWLKFEHDLINHRITWLLTSQALLFAALGLTLQAAPDLKFFRVIVGVGLFICVAMVVSLGASMLAKWCCYRDYKNFFETELPAESAPWGLRNAGKPKVEFGMRTWATVAGIIGDGLVPIIFAVAWLILLVNSRSIVSAAK